MQLFVPRLRGLVSLSSSAALLLILLAWAPLVHAQAIYTCVDAKGRKVTSDRPIAECSDRDQKELSGSGTVKRIVKPVPTAEEQRDAEEKAKAEAEVRAQQAEEKRRDRALLTRFPNRAAHDSERVSALQQVDEVTKAVRKRIVDLGAQRKALDLEMEFYRKDPSKAPGSLKRQVTENDASVTEQKRFIDSQEQEKLRLNQRFDEELVKLKGLWALQVPAKPASASR